MFESYLDKINFGKKAYGSAMEPLCRKWDLTRSEVDVLMFLFNNPEADRAVDIVNYRGLVKSHVSLSVAGLEQRGFLERVPDPTDHRTVHLKLLPKAEPVAREGKDLQNAFLARLMEDIPEEEIRVFMAVKKKMDENISAMVMSED